MSSQRLIRELALQALYQFDARGDADVEDIRRSIDAAPVDAEAKVRGMELANAAWAAHADADAAVAAITPDWPTHRQPPVDRSILRLAFYEIAAGRAPATVVINEAIELAKTFGTEKSPAFVNGVLDRIARQLAGESPAVEGPVIVTPSEPPPCNPLATRLPGESPIDP